jgi:pyruvate/2-oxoglutarate dehydrogenase complex dihydrolipoamide dehydrogenase (E3) component
MTSAPERYEVLVLGSGEGGKYLAWHMAKAGHRTAVVEQKLIGGSCPNTNCLPSKNEIWSAKVAALVGQADRFGMVRGPAVVDMRKVQARKRQMVDGLIAMRLHNYKASGAELVMAPASSLPRGPSKSASMMVRFLTGERVVLNVGTHATTPEVPGLAAAPKRFTDPPARAGRPGRGGCSAAWHRFSCHEAADRRCSALLDHL